MQLMLLGMALISKFKVPTSSKTFSKKQPHKDRSIIQEYSIPPGINSHRVCG